MGDSITGSAPEVKDTTPAAFVNRGLGDAIVDVLLGPGRSVAAGGGSFTTAPVGGSGGAVAVNTGGGGSGIGDTDAQGATAASAGRTPTQAAVDYLASLGYTIPGYEATSSGTGTGGGDTSTPVGTSGTGLLYGGQSATDFLANTDLTQFAAPLSANEQALIDELTASARGIASDTSGARKAITDLYLSPGESGFLAGLDPIITAAADALNRPLLTDLTNEFTRAGQFVQGEGSLPFTAEALRTVEDTTAALTADLYPAALDFAASQTALLPELSDAEVSALGEALSAEALPRLIEQRGIDTGLEVFNDQMDTILQALSIATNGITGNSTTLPGQEGALGDILGAGGKLATGYAFGPGGSSGKG